ncbi:hypothetical protein J3459_016565 [Metarhizium acridum]|nr:hypothetical protein J3459_016565 [Metarhizium acridum]
MHPSSGFNFAFGLHFFGVASERVGADRNGSCCRGFPMTSADLLAVHLVLARYDLYNALRIAKSSDSFTMLHAHPADCHLPWTKSLGHDEGPLTPRLRNASPNRRRSLVSEKARSSSTDDGSAKS